MFLNKFLASSGVASRRKAVEEIKSGLVTVNNEVVIDPAYQVKDSDKVKYKSRIVKPQSYVYILLNKPAGYLTTLSDPLARNTIMELIKFKGKARIYPVGRLDKETTGLLLLTNDGDLAQCLAHPKYEVSKLYEVVLDQEFSSANFAKLLKGVSLKDGTTKVDKVYYTKRPNLKKVSVELHSGKNRIVRRLFKALGYNVVKLDRVLYAGISKRGLPKGEWRYLTSKEIGSLKNL